MAYAVRVLHSEREQFEKLQGWTIKRMDTLEHNPVHKVDYTPEALEPSPVQEEYAPVIFAQDTISHVVSLDMLSGKVSFFSIFSMFILVIFSVRVVELTLKCNIIAIASKLTFCQP